MTRRSRLSAGGSDTTGSKGRIPLVHITDLYHPPQDPDDHADLATIVALPEYDLRAVVLDATRRFLVPEPEGRDIARDPGFVPVAQLGHLSGRAILAAAGPVEPLASVDDDASDRPTIEQAGINLLLETLERSEEAVTISVVGSCRVLAAALNRAPDVLRSKTRAILLNAGSTVGPEREWNVGLDPFAFERLWRSGLPIHWFPCGTDSGAFDPAHGRGTFWKVDHATLFRDLAPGLRAWFAYALSNSPRGDIIHAIHADDPLSMLAGIPDGERNMWSTISLVLGAGRMLAQTPGGWRFLSSDDAKGLPCWPCHLDPIHATVDSEAFVSWEPTRGRTPHLLFGRKPGKGYGVAMAEALNALLRSFSMDCEAQPIAIQGEAPNS